MSFCAASTPSICFSVSAICLTREPRWRRRRGLRRRGLLRRRLLGLRQHVAAGNGSHRERETGNAQGTGGRTNDLTHGSLLGGFRLASDGSKLTRRRFKSARECGGKSWRKKIGHTIFQRSRSLPWRDPDHVGSIIVRCSERWLNQREPCASNRPVAARRVSRVHHNESRASLKQKRRLPKGSGVLFDRDT